MNNKLSKSYIKVVLTVALPVMIQQFITAFANLIDNIMVGTNGKDAINAVGASGSIFFVIMLVGYGVSNGAGIFIAQEYGSKKFKEMKYTFLISIISAIIMGVLSLLLVSNFKEVLINFFTREESQHILAYEYLRVAVFTYPIILVSMSIAGAYRSCGSTVEPMIAGVIAIVINTGLNYLLINGNLGAPKLGVQGAAIATLAARSIELLILIVIMEKKHMPFRPLFKDIFKIPLSLVKKIAKTAAPLTLNEFLWGLGMTTLIALYGIKSADNLTAVQMAYTTSNLLFVIMSGFATAGSVLVGHALGAWELEKAKSHSIKLIKLALITGFIITILAIILSFITPELYSVSEEIKNNSANILRVMSVYFPVFVVTGTAFFVLRAGGDSKGVLIVDGVFMWLIAIPISFVVNNCLPFGIVLSYLIVQSTEILKLTAILIRYKKGRWLKKLV